MAQIVVISNVTLGASVSTVKVYHTSVSSNNQIGLPQGYPASAFSSPVFIYDVPDSATQIILVDQGFCRTQQVIQLLGVTPTPVPTQTPTVTPTITPTPTQACSQAYWCITSGDIYPMSYSVTETTGRFVNGTGSTIQVFIAATSTNTGACNVVLKNSSNSTVATASGTFTYPFQYIYSSPFYISAGASLTYSLEQNGSNASGLQVQLIYGTTSNPGDASPLLYQSPSCCVFTTPTPTATPTPTLTCLEYQVDNSYSLGGPTGSITYRDCNGVQQTTYVYPDSSDTICATQILSYNVVSYAPTGYSC